MGKQDIVMLKRRKHTALPRRLSLEGTQSSWAQSSWTYKATTIVSPHFLRMSAGSANEVPAEVKIDQ